MNLPSIQQPTQTNPSTVSKMTNLYAPYAPGCSDHLSLPLPKKPPDCETKLLPKPRPFSHSSLPTMSVTPISNHYWKPPDPIAQQCSKDVPQHSNQPQTPSQLPYTSQLFTLPPCHSLQLKQLDKHNQQDLKPP